MNYSNGIAWHPAGFQVEIQRVTGKGERCLVVSDINQKSRILKVLSRMELFRLGMLLAWRAVFARTPAEDAQRNHPN